MQAETIIPPPPNLTINELLSRNVALASPPEVFLRVSQLIDDPTKNAFDVQRVIENDPALTARLLKIVNSSIFGFKSKISSIAHAITILGTQELRNLVLATVVIDKFSSLPIEFGSMRTFWSNSVRCAILAKCLAAHHPESAMIKAPFVSGLLHEFGRLVICYHIPELVRVASALAVSEGVDETQGQQKIIGFDHYQVGAELARRWNFPLVVITTINFHNNPEDAKEYALETWVVNLANRLSTKDTTNQNVLDSVFQSEASLCNLLSLTPDVLDTVIEEADLQFDEIFKLIYQ